MFVLEGNFWDALPAVVRISALGCSRGIDRAGYKEHGRANSRHFV